MPMSWYKIIVLVELHRDAYVKDLGVVFDEKLNFSQHISERIDKAYMLRLIKRNLISET